MLNIYNRQKQLVGGLFTSGLNQEVLDVKISKRLNTTYELSFTLPMTSPKYRLIQNEGLIECEGQLYIIKGKKRQRQGQGRLVEITCQHILRRMMDIRIPYAAALDEALGTEIHTLTDIITAATGNLFKFQIMDVFELKDVYKWGYSNCLKAFQDLVNLYEAEFIPDNYLIRVYKKININNGAHYRYSKNIISDTFETNTDTLVTRMTGLAKDGLTIINLATSHLTPEELARLNVIPGAIENGKIKVPYLVSQYVTSWATPDNTFFDGEFEDSNIEADTEEGKLLLLEEIRKKLAAAEVPELQIEVDAADLWKNSVNEFRPQIGETVQLVDNDMELDGITARVMELTEYPFDPSKNAQVTLANYMLKDFNDILADLNASKKEWEGLLTNGQLNTSYFEDFARQAVIDINKAKTQIIYDERGEVMQSKLNPMHQMVLTSEGLVITTNGMVTADVAITAKGIAAAYITGVLGQFAQVKTDNLIAGSVKISSALIDSIKANQIIAGDLGQKIPDEIIQSSKYWNSVEGKATTYADNVNSGLRNDLRLSAALPTSIAMNASGITAYTSDPNSYARLDYRGLYAKNGGLQFDATRSDGVIRTIITGDGLRIQKSGTDIFYNDSQGNLFARGIITADDFRLRNGQSIITSDGSKISKNFIEKLTANEIDVGTLYVGSGGIRIDSSASISWNNVTSKPFIPQKASDVGAISSTYIDSNGVWTGYLNADKITSGTISASRITSGTMSADRISGGNMYIDDKYYLKSNNFGNGLSWGDNGSWGTRRAEIYIDPAANAMYLRTTGGGIYANGNRIDVAPVAKFA